MNLLSTTNAVALLVLATTLSSASMAQRLASEKAQSLPSIPLAIAGTKITAEVAKTPEQRALGLMYRFSLQPDHGMIFVFERAEQQSFWMRNTYIPLSIAFIGVDGRIINIMDMAPHDESMHMSRGPAPYALEMRKGWFDQRGIRPGDKVEGLPPAGR
jgi:uncharacterized membrane protein (UPF0127 family)